MVNTVDDNLKYSVFDYLNLSSEAKLEFFMETRSSLSFLASYWFDFDNVKANISNYDEPDLYTLDYLIGKSDQEIDNFFKKRPNLLLLLPKLLGIRDSKFEKPIRNRILKVQDVSGVYTLNFKDIDLSKLDLYLQFIHDSGLDWVFKIGLRKSVHDYVVGVEAGMDSNGRKNRSGDMGELYLETALKKIAKEKAWLAHGQSTRSSIKNWYGIDLDKSFENRRFDGSLFNPVRKKLYLFEVNNFNSSGSKSKASATEFKDLHDRFSRTNHEFIYITDGKGWDSDKSHLMEAMKYIGKVFNYKMIESDYLNDYLE
ncbi:type II restriction endonuclease [Streptococcus mutans]|uniref:type II restriction endonuclease n=1 Tax=Streptococcus mutans TaxID=1309 RepID=UPI0028ED9453|nr:type II restriction endonuclease [Streptococcus mutans]MDT9542368.1 type II restriction endonuclease [Streptococcus mutans]MDT9556409.1 type II restriction endonuclease [Streptococcus mutans]MDT9595843.1 type II restriction endonuclease [Streptococcus mutans]